MDDRREQTVLAITRRLLDERLIDQVDLDDLLSVLEQHTRDNARAVEITGEMRSLRLALYLNADTKGSELGDVVQFSQPMPGAAGRTNS